MRIWLCDWKVPWDFPENSENVHIKKLKSQESKKNCQVFICMGLPHFAPKDQSLKESSCNPLTIPWKVERVKHCSLVERKFLGLDNQDHKCRGWCKVVLHYASSVASYTLSPPGMDIWKPLSLSLPPFHCLLGILSPLPPALPLFSSSLMFCCFLFTTSSSN